MDEASQPISVTMAMALTKWTGCLMLLVSSFSQIGILLRGQEKTRYNMPPGVGNGCKRGWMVYYESLNLWLLLYSESVSVSPLPAGGNVDDPS